MQKKMIKLEIGGIFFVIIMSVFMQNFYELSNHELIGIMFGSVNDSIWETAKTILFPYLLWGMIELLCVHPPFRKFAAIKIFTLYFAGTLYILLCLIFSPFGALSHSIPELTAELVCIIFSSYLSYRLLFNDYEFEKLFMPSFFLLLLFIAFYCSFTPFPPKIYIFMDRATNLYGLIPDNIDAGAIVLDTLFRV